MCQAQPNSTTAVTTSSDNLTTTMDATGNKRVDGESLTEWFEELKDRIAVMKHKESTTYRPLPNTGQYDLWRPIMISWMFSMVDMFRLVPMIPSTAMWYLDNASNLIHTPEDYQLAGLTCLNMAIKVHETKIFPLEQLVRIGNTGITCNQVIEMERKLLKALQWKLHPTTPECFVYMYAELVPEEHRTVLVHMSLRHVRQAVSLLQQHSFSNSVLAYAGVLVALDEVSLSLEDKESFGLRMMQVAGLSANTQGLLEAFQWLSPTPGQTDPKQLLQSGTEPQQHQQEHQEEEYHLKQQQRQQLPAQAEEPPSQCKSPYRQEVIYFDGDGFEISLCENGKLDEIELSGSLSPRDVVL